MSKGQIGREAGHHCTPAQGWRWQQFGDRVMLVTDGGGADVVLSGRHMGGGKCQLITCGADGLMAPIAPDSPMGILLANIPALVDALRDVRDRNDRPRQLPMIQQALAAAGIE